MFGPAARPLPQLPISVDDEGYLIAQSDFTEPVGPELLGALADDRPSVTPVARARLAAAQRTTSTSVTGARTGVKKSSRKVFPDHWSFLLGEIALFSFIMLLLSGVFLTSSSSRAWQEVIYDGR